jgi:hypothetical protein
VLGPLSGAICIEEQISENVLHPQVHSSLTYMHTTPSLGSTQTLLPRNLAGLSGIIQDQRLGKHTHRIVLPAIFLSYHGPGTHQAQDSSLRDLHTVTLNVHRSSPPSTCYQETWHIRQPRMGHSQEPLNAMVSSLQPRQKKFQVTSMRKDQTC